MYRRTYLSITTGACVGALAGCTDSSPEDESSENGSNASSGNTNTTNESESADTNDTTENESDTNDTTENESDTEEIDDNSSDDVDDSDAENDTDEGDSEEENTSEDENSPAEENSTDGNSSDEGEALSQSDLETNPEAADAQVDSQEVNELEVNIDYSGEWSGIVGDSISTYPIDGSGPESRILSIDDVADVGSIAVRKRDSGSEELTVAIAADGTTVAQDTTTDKSQPASTSVGVN